MLLSISAASRRLLILLAVLASPSAWSEARAEADARTFVSAIYEHYLSANGPGIGLATRESLDRYFDPPLANLIMADRDEAERNDEVPRLNGDPFIDAQDWQVDALDVRVEETGETSAEAIVSFTNFGEPRTVRLLLVRVGEDWRVADVIWRDGSLKALLADAVR